MQASVPVLVSQENLMAANSVVNIISSFSALLGPVLGGILYSAYGLTPVLWVCILCFLLSAFMELFIKIPFVKQKTGSKLREMIREDFSQSITFIRKEKPVIGKVLVAICGINLFLSSMIIVALPYIITEVLNFDTTFANKLYGFAQGALAAGGLVGGIGSGIFAKKLSVQKSGNLLILAAVSVFPMGISLMFSSGFASYFTITICCFIIMIFSTIFTVSMMSFVQAETPQHLIGKVIAVILTIAMCTQPAGNALYGIFFEICKGYEYVVVLFAGGISLIIAVSAKNIFKMFLLQEK